MNLKSKIQTSLLFVGMLMCFGGMYGQEDGDISEYLDDDDITKATRMILINPGALLAGDVPLSFEQLVLKRLGLEVGAGVILPFYVWELWPLDEAFPSGAAQKTGYSLYLHPKLYLTSRAPEFHFIGIMYRRRQYNFEGAESLVSRDFTANWGYNVFIRDRYTFGIDTGFGWGFYGERGANGTPFDGNRFVYFNLLRFGLVF